MGCLAGPLCVAVVAFPANTQPIKGVGDSKKISAKKRTELAPIIMKEAAFFGIGWAHPSVIDEKGLAEAWRRACFDALEGAPPLSLLQIDGDKPLKGYLGKQQSIVKGDSKIWQIGAASIVAKVVRDLEMVGMSKHYPAYRWEKNMGYGSKEHLEALFRLGPTGYHRGFYLRKIYNKFKDRIDQEKESWKKWAGAWMQHLVTEEEEDLSY